jgi:hypothetical protein
VAHSVAASAPVPQINASPTRRRHSKSGLAEVGDDRSVIEKVLETEVLANPGDKPGRLCLNFSPDLLGQRRWK